MVQLYLDEDATFLNSYLQQVLYHTEKFHKNTLALTATTVEPTVTYKWVGTVPRYRSVPYRTVPYLNIVYIYRTR